MTYLAAGLLQNISKCNHCNAASEQIIIIMDHHLIANYCILRGWIKGFYRSITTIMCEDGSYRTAVG